eukprot:9488849-Pyramimonas_sp.AAC.1
MRAGVVATRPRSRRAGTAPRLGAGAASGGARPCSAGRGGRRQGGWPWRRPSLRCLCLPPSAQRRPPS